MHTRGSIRAVHDIMTDISESETMDVCILNTMYITFLTLILETLLMHACVSPVYYHTSLVYFSKSLSSNSYLGILCNDMRAEICIITLYYSQLYIYTCNMRTLNIPEWVL